MNLFYNHFNVSVNCRCNFSVSTPTPTDRGTQKKAGGRESETGDGGGGGGEEGVGGEDSHAAEVPGGGKEADEDRGEEFIPLTKSTSSFLPPSLQCAWGFGTDSLVRETFVFAFSAAGEPK